jgi:FkbM family methyltransferase
MFLNHRVKLRRLRGKANDLTFYSKEFSLNHRLISWVSRSLSFSYTSRRGLTAGLKRQGGLGFLPGGRCTPEEEFLRKLDLRGKTIYDVGGFLGLMTLFFASRAKHVVTYEPLPESRRRITTNLELNGFRNVTLRDVALSSEPGDLTLAFDDLMSGGASGDPEISRELASSAAHPKHVTVPVTTIDLEIASGQPIPDLIKVDVEGMEYEVLRGMFGLLAKSKPWVYFELHGTTHEDKRTNAQDVIGKLKDLGYTVYDVERGRDIGRSETITGIESHVWGRCRE